MNTDLLFIHESLPETFRELFFGPMELEERFETFSDHDIMANIIARAGVFSSVTQARKNGWDKPIPQGFSSTMIKKTRRNIFILNVFPGWQD